MKIYFKAVHLLMISFLVIIILSLAISGSGCSSSKPGKLDKIVISSPFTPLALPLAYIIENNLLEDVAEEVELIIWNNPEQLSAIITQGQADFVSVPSNVASKFYNKGIGLKFLKVSIWGVFYIISDDPSIQLLQDLKGKELYIPFKGDQPDLIFRYIAQEQGLNPDEDFQLQYVSSPLDIILNLTAGKAHHAMMLEPAAALAIMKAKKEGLTFDRVIDIQEEWGAVTGGEPRLPNAGVIALPGILEHPEIVEAFQQAYDESVKWSTEHPKEAAELTAEYVEGVNAASFEESLSYTIFESISAKDVQDEIEGMLTKFMAFDPTSIGGKLPDEAFYYDKP